MNINRNPLGLLGFLGIKNFGRNPQTLSDNLAPTWDLSELYLNSAPQFAEDTDLGVAAAGLYVSHSPPQGEIWFVSDCSAYVQTAGGTTAVVNLARVGQVNSLYVSISDWLLIGPAQIRNIYSPRCPLVLGQGERIGYYVSDLSGGTFNIAVAIRYTPMTI